MVMELMSMQLAHTCVFKRGGELIAMTPGFERPVEKDDMMAVERAFEDPASQEPVSVPLSVTCCWCKGVLVLMLV